MTAAVAAVPEQVLEFTLGADRYCVGIDHVEEIVKARDLTPLPNTPAQIAGMMDLRGTSTTILDPKRVLEVDGSATSQQVIVFGGEERIGWLVDGVHRVSTLDDVDVDTIPESTHVDGVISDDGEFIIWVEPDSVNGSVTV